MVTAKQWKGMINGHEHIIHMAYNNGVFQFIEKQKHEDTGAIRGNLGIRINRSSSILATRYKLYGNALIIDPKGPRQTSRYYYRAAYYPGLIDVFADFIDSIDIYLVNNTKPPKSPNHRNRQKKKN